MSIANRLNIVRENRLCYNCFSANHSSRICRSGKCRTCSRKHHTLIHQQETSTNTSNNESSSSQTTAQPPANNSTTQVNAHHTHTHPTADSETIMSPPCTVLLATACVTLKAQDGTLHIVRALMDTGSQASFISEECVHLLKLKRQHVAIKVNGVGSSDAGTIRGMVCTQMGSQYDNSLSFMINALVLNRITTYLPSSDLSQHEFPHLNGITLADQSFFKPGRIDILLGADVYSNVIMDGIIRGEKGMPIAQRTALGWIISGAVKTTHTSFTATSLHANTKLEFALRRFWEVEAITDNENWTEEENNCDEHFKRTHSRNCDGKFIVRMPFKSNINQLGSNKSSAIARLKQIESKFKRNPKIKEQYIAFMKEYEELGHMSKVPLNEMQSSNSYYIPHHSVCKEESTTTKLRVVFDASNKSTTGLSLNDCQMIGPRLQSDLYIILLRFRKYAIGITADITKMYRQIIVHEEDRNLQRIVWRVGDTDDITEYKLNTVTYGTASAPFLAVRSLIECANVESRNCEQARKAIVNDMYVDDLITGADDEESAVVLQNDISSTLSRGGFELRKWASSNEKVLQAIPPNQRERKELLQFKNDESIKALGIYWFPSLDYFGFIVKLPHHHENWSKRTILADTARLFDPLGLLAPIIISAKILLQRLWLIGVDWDEAVPLSVSAQWTSYRNDLPNIERIKVPRWLGTNAAGTRSQLHAFCDASEAAYAAVIYIRNVDSLGRVSVNLITSKTKVSPVQKITLPRLELCGAVLLIKLLVKVKNALNIDEISCHAWSDSMVVLAWLRKLPCHWKTFVANRVSQIQNVLGPSHWKYVPSKENPADVASRGIMPSELITHPLWWHGPSWLLDTNDDNWPNKLCPETSFESKKVEIVTMNCTISIVDCVIIDKYSSLLRLKLVTAFVNRFIFNARRPPTDRRRGPINPSELDSAVLFWIKHAQQTTYVDELACINANSLLPKRSQLLSLNPFVDDNGIIRVGGRINASSLPYNTKHPIILPPPAKITQLILAHTHMKLLHAGVQLMVAHIRHEYWIPRARSIVRQHIHSCIPCFRQKRKIAQQQMGNLPSQRLSPGRAFLNSGVDYAGPIQLKTSNLRNCKIVKGYIAVFVCLVTRALHLEMVSDLSTEAFIAAFRRFIGRRGKCQTLMSDNGTNFVGAQRELKSLTNMLQSQYISSQFAAEGTQWKLIPPSAPHFGGIWEAGVKSVKHHLRRVLGTTRLTFEEMATLLVQIEACVNSRPLTPLTDDPADINVLTPGHFLIGEPVSAVPDPNLMELKLNTLSRWQHVQRMQQDFWSRWQKEYICELQQRPKWMQTQPNVEKGNIVLIKDECLPPTHWPLARITSTHPGADGMVRVVNMQYHGGSITRPIHKICVLPIMK